MASSSSTVDSTVTPTLSTATAGAVSIHTSVNTKLTRDNFRLWKATIVPILKGHSLFGFVDGSFSCPPQNITTETEDGATVIINPACKTWQMQDQLILGALTSSLSESVLSHVVQCTTSRETWQSLERMFSSQCKARVMQVHYQLATLRKGNLSVADYFQRFQSLADALAAVDQPLNDFELISFLLAGLGSDYDSFVTSVTTRVEPLSLEDLYGHLLAHEQRLAHNIASIDLSHAGAQFAAKGKTPSYHGYRGRGRQSSHRGQHSFNYRGRGRGSSQFPRNSGSSSQPRHVCQVCNKLGHVALDCYHRFDNSFNRESSSNLHYSSHTS
jgi:hypothetical protein